MIECPVIGKRAAILIMAALFFACSFFVSAEQEKIPRLEGVMANPRSPHESVAIINGQMVKKGDVFDRYNVLEIGADYCLLGVADSAEVVRVTIDSEKPTTKDSPER
ncbi:MAG: hypothetical protein PHS37_05930 [Candidatus Omnitrophica bacterium]|nr:hypothetical protein [Candidatus Omnitrophota bacterium]